MAAIDAAEWEMVAYKTVIVTGSKDPSIAFKSSLELGILPSGKIAGMKYPGTSGVEQVVGGFFNGETLNLWVMLFKPGTTLDQEQWDGGGEYVGTASAPGQYTGTWKDTHGNEGKFTMTRMS